MATYGAHHARMMPSMYRVEMSFGHRDQDGTQVAPGRIQQAERLVLRVFAQRFGGAQCQHHVGASVNGHSVVVQ